MILQSGDETSSNQAMNFRLNELQIYHWPIVTKALKCALRRRTVNILQSAEYSRKQFEFEGLSYTTLGDK